MPLSLFYSLLASFFPLFYSFLSLLFLLSYFSNISSSSIFFSFSFSVQIIMVCAWFPVILIICIFLSLRSFTIFFLSSLFSLSFSCPYFLMPPRLPLHSSSSFLLLSPPPFTKPHFLNLISSTVFLPPSLPPVSPQPCPTPLFPHSSASPSSSRRPRKCPSPKCISLKRPP